MLERFGSLLQRLLPLPSIFHVWDIFPQLGTVTFLRKNFCASNTATNELFFFNVRLRGVFYRSLFVAAIEIKF